MNKCYRNIKLYIIRLQTSEKMLTNFVAWKGELFAIGELIDFVALFVDISLDKLTFNWGGGNVRARADRMNCYTNNQIAKSLCIVAKDAYCIPKSLT